MLLLLDFDWLIDLFFLIIQMKFKTVVLKFNGLDN